MDNSSGVCVSASIEGGRGGREVTGEVFSQSRIEALECAVARISSATAGAGLVDVASAVDSAEGAPGVSPSAEAVWEKTVEVDWAWFRSKGPVLK